MDYPKTLIDNLRYRAALLQKAENDIELQAVLRERCRRDVLYFINVFCWTYDPRVKARHLPFITYPFQDELIIWDKQAAVKQLDTLVDKSRDVGATWCLEGDDLHDWLFTKATLDILWGSRKEDYVDERGNMDTIFEKFRYLLRKLPKWMLPKGFDWSKHDNSMRLINPETGSVIIGESTNENFSRGGRKYRIRFDEFAFWECDEAAWRASADTTKCRTALSTPNGSSNKFAQLAKGTSGEKIEKRSLHWTLHPVKAQGAYYFNGQEKIDVLPDRANGVHLTGVKVRSPWYDAECDRRTPQDVAQELDIDYLASGSPFFDLKALKIQRKWEHYERVDKTLPVPYGKFITGDLQDVNNSVRFVERQGGWLRVFELPDSAKDYALGNDTAEGLPKGDASAAVVMDKYTRNTVATINGQIRPEDFAYKTWLLEKFYGGCKNAPENNNHGYTTCLELGRLGSNLYIAAGESKRGWTTNSKTRPMMLDLFEEDVRKNACELRDPDLIAQCETFVNKKNGKPEADGVFHDDLVMSRAICGQVIREYPYKPRASNSHKRAALVDEKRKMRKRY